MESADYHAHEAAQAGAENDSSDNRVVLSLSDIEDSTLVLLSYVCLCLGDFVVARKYALNVMHKDAAVSERLRHLARAYYTEAQCSLGSVKASDLELYSTGDDNTCLAPTAKLANMAAALLLGGDLAGALQRYSRAYSLSPSDPVVLRGIVYIYLRQGKVKEALQLAKKATGGIVV
jgi:tetratricopeptide (TPR) repeat protein